ncbi:MAG: hypothetical protein VKP72_12425 [bacterium]|nr:hypothetical protein [bacterium]
MTNHRNRFRHDFWAAVEATPARVLETTLRVLVPWVIQVAVTMLLQAHLPLRIVSVGFAGWLAGFALAWACGRGGSAGAMSWLTVVFPLVGATVGLLGMDGDVPRSLMLLAFWWMIHLLFDGAIRMRLLVGGCPPRLVWPCWRPSPDDWIPRALPDELERQILAVLPFAPGGLQPDPRSLELLGLHFPCTSGELARAFERRAVDLLAGNPGPAGRVRILRELGRSRQLVEEAIRAARVAEQSGFPASSDLVGAMAAGIDSPVLRQGLRILDPVASVRMFGPVRNWPRLRRMGAVAVMVSVVVGPVLGATLLIETWGTLALDDHGDRRTHHDHIVTKDGVSSTFVWVPVFEAYQLIVPGNCGAGNRDRPPGFWVADRPVYGREDVDWAREIFGGFYAGKFEASRADATPGNPGTGSGATAGSSDTLKIAPQCSPWTFVTWVEAVQVCQDYDPACHLMRDDEWTALAVWSMIHDHTVRGNNSATLSDVEDTRIRFVRDPAGQMNQRALTGSGTRSGWSRGVNLTTHTGTNSGVYDLNGNVWEWTATLGGVRGTARYAVNDGDTEVSMPASSRIMSLNTDARVRRYGVPGTTGRGRAAFGQDAFIRHDDSTREDTWMTFVVLAGIFPTNFQHRSASTVACRGGNHYYDTLAGVWHLSIRKGHAVTSHDIGFRPVLRY